ncbi:MAG: hypothetical protein WCD69_18730, partial [Xanthobacteraceae bacterium]
MPFKSMYSLVTPVTLSNNPSASEMNPDAGCAEKSDPFPTTVNGRVPLARKKGVFGGLMHGTSVQVVSGYFAVKQVFLGRFVCTIDCRQLSSWLTLGVGFTFEPEGSLGAANPVLEATVVNTAQTPSILIVCDRPTPNLSIRSSRRAAAFHEGHFWRLKDYQFVAFALCPWSQGRQCPLWV